MVKGKRTKREKREEVEIGARVHVGEQTAGAIASFPTSFPGVTPGSGKGIGGGVRVEEGRVLITSRFWARGWVAPPQAAAHGGMHERRGHDRGGEGPGER